MKWIPKVNKQESIRKDTYNKPEYGISLYQLWSSQPGLVPQFSGKLTSARVWSTQVMVNNLSDLTYVHMMRRSGHEGYLARKSAV